MLIAIFGIGPRVCAESSYKYLDECNIVQSSSYQGNEGDSFVDVIGINKNTRGNQDINGNVYKHGLEAWIARWNNHAERSWAYAVFDIGNEYHFLSAQLVLIQSANTTNFDSTLGFYDGETLIKSYHLTPKSIPSEIEVDVSGVEQLKVYVHDNTAVKSGTSIGIVNAKLENIKRYNDNKTVYLDECNIIQASSYQGNEGDSFIDVIGKNQYTRGNKDINGNAYDHGIEAWIARWNYQAESSWAYAVFNIGKRFHSLTAQIVLIQSANTTNFDSTLDFYNGDTLIKSYHLTPKTIPSEIEVNVSGVEQLKVYVHDNIAVKSGTSIGIVNAILNESGNYNGSDQEIIDQVKRYTRAAEYGQFDEILNSDLSFEEKFKRWNELYNNLGITDPREGIEYLSDRDGYHWDYEYLVNDDIYCAHNYFDWMNTTVKGKLARGLLYADGLIFNYELTSYMDFSTYVESDYPGVKKNKAMLKTFLEKTSGEDDEITATEAASTILRKAKKIGKIANTMLRINRLEKDAEAEVLMNKIIKCTDANKLDQLQQQFAEMIVSKCNSVGSDAVYCDIEILSKSMGYAMPILSFAGATVSDVVDIINLETDMQLYESNRRFLNTIYEDTNVSWEMRYAAYLLLEEIESGYFNKISSIVVEIMDFTKNMVYMDQSMLETYLSAHNISTTGVGLLGDAIGTITLSTIISNIVVNMGDFVKQVAYTQGYAELGAAFSKRLQKDKEEFISSQTAENAWQFFEDYTTLWNLRYFGEQQYLDMSSVKMFIFSSVPTFDYDQKVDVVTDNLRHLENCRFELAGTKEIPESVQYMKKAVIECPVDVYVYSPDGELVATLKDGQLNDTTNEYGRFSVVRESYSGEYAKVICQTTDDKLKIKMKAVADGVVDFQAAEKQSTKVKTFDRVEVSKGDRIEVENESCTIENQDGSAVIELKEKDTEKYIKVESATLTKEAVEIDVDQSTLVNVIIQPINATSTTVDWVTLDPSIATVKNGVITGVTSGETTIVAKVIDSLDLELELPVVVKPKPEPMITEMGHNLNLSGSIGVNYFLHLSDEVLADEGAKVHFDLPNGLTSEVMVKDAKVQMVKGMECRGFGCKLHSSQMTGTIKAKVILSDGTESEEFPYMVKEYADLIIANPDKNSSFTKVTPLIKAMLNYGGYAQAYFKYDDNPLANKDLTAEERNAIQAVTAEDVKAFERVVTGTQEGLKYEGSNLMLTSETCIRHFFTVQSGHDISEYSFKMDGKTLTPVKSGNMYYIEISNIASGNLDTTYTLTVGGITVKYSALSYVYTQLSKENLDSALANVLKALYLYNQEANKYFVK